MLADFAAAKSRGPVTEEDDRRSAKNAELVSSLKATLQRKNAEIRELKADVGALANRIALLTEENKHLRSGTGAIVPITKQSRGK